MLSFSYDPARGGAHINWSMASCGGPSLDPPDQDTEDDQSTRTDLDEGACGEGCQEDFNISIELD